MIKINDISKVFRTSEVETVALNHVNLEVKEGEFVAIMGPSGCGKSTLLNILGLLDNPTEGSYKLLGQEVAELKEKERTRVRKGKLGFVFQSFNLIDELNVYENVELPLTYLGVKAGERKRMVDDILKRMNISHRAKHFPQQLSGGQQQRVAIARALVKKPDVLLLDEPLSNLDARLRMEMRSEIRRIQQESKVTTIFVTHDQEEAMSITDEIVLMRQGVVQQVAGAHEMYMDPANSFVASFMGNPPISYVDVQVGGGSAVLENGLRLPCRSDYAGHAKMGIRPEAWALGGDLSVTLTDVEMRGQDQVVSFTLAGQPVRAILNAEEYVRPGQEVHLRLSEKRCYRFNPETGVRL